MECRNPRQSVSVSNSIRFNNMKSLVLFVVLLIVAFGKSDALITCSCSNCTSGDTCQGEICYSRVIIGKSPGDDPVYKQGCYFNPQASLCNTSTDWRTTLCCETHLCNVDLDPMLTSGDSSTSSADYTFSTDIFSSTDDGGSTNLEPTVSVSTPPPPPSASVPPSDGNCYQSDSSSGDPTEVHLCTLQTFCFSTLRRKSDGTVVYKRGCSRTCTEETRNRKIKRCCSHSLCNLLIQDPLEENGSGTTTAMPLTPETTTPISPSSPITTTSSQPSPPPPTTVSPLVTYRPPILEPRPSTPTLPTSPPPTTPPSGGGGGGNNQSDLICYCDTCGNEATICRTGGACATLWNFPIPQPGSIPDPNPDLHVTVTNFCIDNVISCKGSVPMNPGQYLQCCNTSYCNNLEEPTTASPSKQEPTTTTAEVASTRNKMTESTSDSIAFTSKTTPTPPVSASQGDLDLYFLVGIGIFVVAGIILVAVVIVVICYCCFTRSSASRKKAKRAAASSCSPTMATIAGGISAAATNVELAIGTKLSFPSPNIYTKQRASVSVSTEGNSSSSGAGSGAPIPEGIPRTSYSSTSV